MLAEKTMNKTLLAYLLTIGITSITGAGTGVILKRTIGPIDEMYPPGFDPKEFSPDVADIMSRYNKLSDKTINGVRSFSDSDVVNIVLEKYKTLDNSYSIGIGNAFTIINQTIRNAQIKNGDEYFEEQISYSDLVNVANRSIQTGANGDVNLYKGSASGPESANYPNSPSKTYSHKGYKDYLGKTLDEMFIYIISEKTTLDSKRVTSGGETKITLNLNPNLATYYYKTQMKNISGLSNLPPFSDVKLVYTFDNNLGLKHLSVDETSTATKEGVPVPAKTHNIIENYYFPNAIKQIPSSSESIDYSIPEE